MGYLNDKERRDFVSQTAVIIEEEAATLTTAGFDPANRLQQLKDEKNAAQLAEVVQQQAQAAALDATKAAQESLMVAYNDASAIINLIEGLLGKDNSLVHKLRQLRG
jgi:triosephosphate isomerase